MCWPESNSNADQTARWIHWDSRVRYCHYGITKWSPPSETAAGQKNVAHPAVGDKAKICLSALYVQPGLIKVSVKPVDKDSKGNGYLRQTFPEISKTKKIDWLRKLNNYSKTKTLVKN